jgi:dihydroxyacetone kinase-like predicted kinase
MSELEKVRALARAALASLEANRQRIDDLNVYPVPDGDTGTNLTLTVRGVVDALDDSTASDRQALAREVTRAALMSARGNSGVILSQIVRGIAAAVTGTELPQPVAPSELPQEALHLEPSRYRYCTTFVIEGDDLDAASLGPELERLGDSLMVVGDRSALKVHVHTDDPGMALSIGTSAGTIEGVEIADMRRQTEEREERLLQAVDPHVRCAAVAVGAGDGNRRLFEGLGAARVVEGGQSMNPSTADLLDAVEATGAEEVVLLPDNPNVLLAAEQAARLAGRPVQVIGTRSLQAGLAALVAFNPERSAEENAAEMSAALEGLAIGEVTVASRDASVDGVAAKEGEFLGLLNEKARAAGPSFPQVARAVAEGLLAEPRDLLTLLTGRDAPPLDGLVDELAERHPGLEIDVQEGGQPHYPLLLSAE